MAEVRGTRKCGVVYLPASLLCRLCDATTVVYGVVMVLLLLPSLRCLTQQTQQEVIMQIIVPYESSAETKLQNTHVFEKEIINNGLEPAYGRLREHFRINTWLNFTETETPGEILHLFCMEVFNKQVNTMLVINYGAGVESSNDYIQKLAGHLGYPVISWDPAYPGALQSVQDSRVLQIAPTLYHQCQAMIRVLGRYNWTEFSIVTSQSSNNNDFVACMKDMIHKKSVKQGFISTNKYKLLSVVDIYFSPYDDYEDKENTIRTELQKLVRSVTRIVLLHAGEIEALTIMDIAVEMGLTASKYQWILTSSSMGRVNSISKYSSTKFPVGTLGITYNDSQETIQEAMKTAIKVWALALNQLASFPSRLAHLTITPTHSCNASRADYWKDGTHLYRAMRSIVFEEPSKPPVSFTDNGIIENVELKIYNARPAPPAPWHRPGRQYKSWDLVGNIVPKKVGDDTELVIEMDEVVWPGGAVFPPKGKPDKRFFRIVTLEEPPYITYVQPDSVTGQCSLHAVPCKLNMVEGNLYKNATRDKNGMVEYCCTGLCVDLLTILSQRMNFHYEMYEVHDREWGIQQNNEWNGLIKDMLDKKADMVITSIKINHQRATAMDFSTPFLETGITIMVALRKGAISATAFLEPYDYPSWCLILVFSVHATGASIFIFEWMSPNGLNKGKTPIREHKFSLFRSFWLIWAMLFGASVSTDNPRGTSSRFLANVWALFALVFLASYTANLAAFMITIDEYYDLTGIEDWRLTNPTAVTPHFRFATIPGGSTEDMFRRNYPTMHKYMHKYMMKFNKTKKVTEGIKSLKSGKIHAFIYDATVLEFNAGRDKDCELITVGKWYAMTGYGVGFPKGSPYMDEVNEIILNLQKEGELDRMVKFWLAGACHAKKEKKDKSSHNIGILNFTSAFILLAAGVLLGTSLLLLEHSYFKFGRKCLKKYDKTGCCSLVSLSMGKSLTFEQSVMDAIDYHRKHRCREPLCETQLWKARHELDLALIKIDRLREELTSLDTRGNEIKATRLNRNEDGRRPMEPNGNSLLHNRDSKADSIYEIPDSVRKIKTSNHFVVDIPVPFDSQEVSQEPVNETMRLNAPEKDVRELSDVDKRRLQFRRSPSYTNAMSVDSDGKESASSIKPSSIYGPVDKDRDGNTCDDAGAQISPLSTGNFNALSTNPTIIQAHAGRGGDKEFSPRRCPSYSQAVEDSPVFAPSSAASPDTNDKHNTRTRYYDGKYYVGVAGDNDESAL